MEKKITDMSREEFDAFMETRRKEDKFQKTLIYIATTLWVAGTILMFCNPEIRQLSTAFMLVALAFAAYATKRGLDSIKEGLNHLL